MGNVMLLSYKYKLIRDKNLECGVYMCQKEKTKNSAQRKSLQEELQFSKNGRSWFHFRQKPILF